MRLPLRPFESSTFISGLPVVKVEDEEVILEGIEKQASLETKSQPPASDEGSVMIDWDENEWAEWEKALQDHAVKLEKRRRWELCLQRVKEILHYRRRFDTMPLHGDWPQSEMEDRSHVDDSSSESGARGNEMSDTVTATSDSCSDQDERHSPEHRRTSIWRDPPPTTIDDNISLFSYDSHQNEKAMTPYNLVMSRWLSIRTPLPGLTALNKLLSSVAPIQPYGVLFENAPICKQCGEHLRRCGCEHCDDCGEVREHCLCQICKQCDEPRDSRCWCTPCTYCGELDNEGRGPRCACYCKCGCPIFGANCCLRTAKELHERRKRVAIQDQRKVECTRRENKVTMMKRMYN